MRFALLLVLLPPLVTACKVGPNFTAPDVSLDPRFPEITSATSAQASHATAAAPITQWWTTFKDPELERLIDQALRQNYDLQIATLRIREARAQRGITAADLFPNVNADGSYAHSRGSKNVILPLGGNSGPSSSAGSAPAVQPFQSLSSNHNSPTVGPDPTALPISPFGQGGLPGVTSDLFQTGFDASWELDIFGGTRRRVEAANAQIAAAVASRADVAVSLLAEVARNYLELRGAQRRLQVAQDNLKTAGDILDITRSARRSGLATDLDVTRASAQLSSITATLPPLVAQIRRSIHALSILLAKQPEELVPELSVPQPLPDLPPEVPIGLPSDLLLRRPDIRRAQFQLAAATANVGVATADLFPKFALTGAVGLDATRFDKLFDWNSRYFLFSPTVVWPIFDAGRIVSNISLQKVTQQEVLLQYRKTLLNALNEVEDALVNYATEQTRRDALAQTVRQSAQALDIARHQYRDGLADFLTVLDAQRTLLNAQDDLAQSDQITLTNLVALYKSLGGGW